MDRTYKLRFFPEDVDAILCALPIMEKAEPESRLQACIGHACRSVIPAKLRRGSDDLTYFDWEEMFNAVELALEITSGRNPQLAQDLGVDDEWLAKLNSYHEVYRQLRPNLKLTLLSLRRV